MADMVGQKLSEQELAELSVRCLTLGLHGAKLLLPNTLVAEVSESSAARAAANTPDWLIGFITWRGRNIPLISFEQLLGLDVPGRHDQSHMVVLNTLNGNPNIPFIAIEIQGLPHLSLFKHGTLEYDENMKKGEPVILAGVRADGESMIVPNIDTIERMLVNLGISV